MREWCVWVWRGDGGRDRRSSSEGLMDRGGRECRSKKEKQTDVRVLLVGRSAGGRPVPCVVELQGGQASGRRGDDDDY